MDISTSYIGWAVLSLEGELLDVGYLKLKKMSEKERIDVLVAFLKSLTFKISRVFVEEALIMANNQFVVSMLQRFNGVCCASIYITLGVIPELITEVNARKLNKIKVPKGVKGIFKKRFVLQFIKNLGIISEDTWKYKRTGNPVDWSYDIADAVVIGRAGYLISEEKD